MIKPSKRNIKIVDLIVLGAGPAGFAAATIASKKGAEVIIIDENRNAGGQIYREPPKGLKPKNTFKSDEFLEGEQQRLSIKNSNIITLFEHKVWSISSELIINTIGPNGLRAIKTRSLIIATGALERIIPFPGWTSPGVIGLAATTILLKSQYVLPGKSTIVAGCGPLLISVAYGILKSGGNISAIIDLNSNLDWIKNFPKMISKPDQLIKGIKWLTEIKKAGVKIFGNHTVTEVKRFNKVLNVSIAPLNKKGNFIEHRRQKSIIGNCLAIGHGLFPSTEITRLLKAKHIFDPIKGGWVPLIDKDFQSSIPRVYIAGDATGISGAFSAVNKGRIAAFSVLRDLNLISKKEFQESKKYELLLLKKNEIFGNASSSLMKFRGELIQTISTKTIVCRCEDVYLSEINKAISLGARDVNQIKAWTRCGMGPCQGRTCSEAVESILANKIGNRESAGQWTGRSPLRPLPIDKIIGNFKYEDIPIPKDAPL